MSTVVEPVPRPTSPSSGGERSSGEKKEKVDLEKDGELPRSTVHEVHIEDPDAIASNGLSAGEVENAQTGGEIQYRTMTLPRAIALLFGEYVSLATLSLAYSFEVLGLAGGMLANLGLGLIALYTSLTLHDYCLKYPGMLNVADVAQHIFGGSRIAYEIFSIFLLLNNIFIMGFHTLTMGKILNTFATSPGKGWCSVAISVLAMVFCAICSLPRTFHRVGLMAIVSAIAMGTAILLTVIFTGIQGRNPPGLKPGETVHITAFSPPGTTFVDGMNAVLNISFCWIGQALYPSFISEMKKPKDFKVALYAVGALQFGLYTVAAVIVYYYTGQYANAPAFVTLKPTFVKIAAAPVLFPTVIIGVIYSVVASKYIFSRIFLGTRHYNNPTVVSNLSWAGIILATWTLAWVVGEAIPFFGSLLSLMSAIFDSFFGFILWAAAYLVLYRGELWTDQPIRRKAETLFNVLFLIPAGLFCLGPGLYTSAVSIRDQYRVGAIKAPFTCTSNSWI